MDAYTYVHCTWNLHRFYCIHLLPMFLKVTLNPCHATILSPTSLPIYIYILYTDIYIYTCIYQGGNIKGSCFALRKTGQIQINEIVL